VITVAGNSSEQQSKIIFTIPGDLNSQRLGTIFFCFAVIK